MLSPDSQNVPCRSTSAGSVLPSRKKPTHRVWSHFEPVTLSLLPVEPIARLLTVAPLASRNATPLRSVELVSLA